MDDNKEKDEVKEIFNRALEIQDSREIENEENKEEKAPDTHNIEYIAPSIALALAIAAIFSLLWFTSYFAILFSGIGIYMCKKRGSFLNRWVLLYNVIVFAISFFIGGMWIMLYLTKLLS